MKALTGIGIGIGLGPWRIAHAQGEGPYGALGVADVNGVRLPARFTSRLLATPRTGATGKSRHAANGAELKVVGIGHVQMAARPVYGDVIRLS